MALDAAADDVGGRVSFAPDARWIPSCALTSDGPSAVRHRFGWPPGCCRERRRTGDGFGDANSAARSSDASAGRWRRSGEMYVGIRATIWASVFKGRFPAPSPLPASSATRSSVYTRTIVCRLTMPTDLACLHLPPCPCSHLGAGRASWQGFYASPECIRSGVQVIRAIHCAQVRICDRCGRPRVGSDTGAPQGGCSCRRRLITVHGADVLGSRCSNSHVHALSDPRSATREHVGTTRAVDQTVYHPRALLQLHDEGRVRGQAGGRSRVRRTRTRSAGVPP